MQRARPALRPARRSFERWRAARSLAGLAAALFSVFVSQALAVREREQFELFVDTSARRVRAEIRAELDARMHAISILAREWQDRLLPRRGDWESDVRLILSQSPGPALDRVGRRERANTAGPIRPRRSCPRSTSTSCARAALRCGARWCSGRCCRRTASRACASSRRLRERGALCGMARRHVLEPRAVQGDPRERRHHVHRRHHRGRGRAVPRRADRSRRSARHPVSHTSLALPGGDSQIEIAWSRRTR